ncbi:hypothetical protein PAXRUDRAFT_827854 [Paxillus rubicundulus Ve08.2h10]|uniref:Uncharacterized protein n=1 Tax=Paxillus rubicundulus Ve08.2h10 TaxID=930991 RepID=A0A0D0DBL7_9AGAM|nr:hypothetical protein PAXRUDRAFT_827854 [Paxillus rubicundulus Ve08.2h10]
MSLRIPNSAFSSEERWNPWSPTSSTGTSIATGMAAPLARLRGASGHDKSYIAIWNAGESCRRTVQAVWNTTDISGATR